MSASTPIVLLKSALVVCVARLANFEAEIARLSMVHKLNWIRRLEFRLRGFKPLCPFWIGTGLTVCSRVGVLRLGRRCNIAENARIGNYADIYIGDDFLAGPSLTIETGSHDEVTLAPTRAEVRIGARVWCGTNVTILAGVRIGDDVIVGAGSLVTRDVPSGMVTYGVPARPVRAVRRPFAKPPFDLPPDNFLNSSDDVSASDGRLRSALGTRGVPAP